MHHYTMSYKRNHLQKYNVTYMYTGLCLAQVHASDDYSYRVH